MFDKLASRLNFYLVVSLTLFMIACGSDKKESVSEIKYKRFFIDHHTMNKENKDIREIYSNAKAVPFTNENRISQYGLHDDYFYVTSRNGDLATFSTVYSPDGQELLNTPYAIIQSGIPTYGINSSAQEIYQYSPKVRQLKTFNFQSEVIDSKTIPFTFASTQYNPTKNSHSFIRSEPSSDLQSTLVTFVELDSDHTETRKKVYQIKGGKDMINKYVWHEYQPYFIEANQNKVIRFNENSFEEYIDLTAYGIAGYTISSFLVDKNFTYVNYKSEGRVYTGIIDTKEKSITSIYNTSPQLITNGKYKLISTKATGLVGGKLGAVLAAKPWENLKRSLDKQKTSLDESLENLEGNFVFTFNYNIPFIKENRFELSQ